ncbi:helix-turn-helix domain-containing protein [Chitiniphilus shinanonensis]|uniref:helix-turn-helix domain-containing protein n=1 Tax=Chitiniphilus shinanonensis TaxID=553088 RepID=UPI00301FA59D
MMAETLNLAQAAAFCHCHRETLRREAKAGRAPGRKVGRAYVFLDEDLVAYVRGDYAPQRQASAGVGVETCRFSDNQHPTTGTLISQRQTENALDVALGLPTGKRRRNTTIA